jgi:hypothetical protein
LKIDASHLIGARLQDVNVALVDQHGVGLSSLLGEAVRIVGEDASSMTSVQQTQLSISMLGRARGMD